MTSPVGHGLLWGAALVLTALSAYVLATWSVPPAVLVAGGFTVVAGSVGVAVVKA